MRKKLIAGNWKMFGSQAFTQNLIAQLQTDPRVDVLVCPPAVYLAQAAQVNPNITIGAQNIAENIGEGAFTGELRGAMLADVGCRYTLVGHSERRQYYGETNAVVAHKTHAALAANLIPVLCVGETRAEREGNLTENVIAEQLEAVIQQVGIAAFETIVIAYEPVWAIGTGLTATPEQAQSVHAFIRAQLAAKAATIAPLCRILYGGSVKPDNAAQLFACEDIDGALVGGASLQAASFNAIIAAALG